MLIHERAGAFYAEASYDERHALKAAGFWWHGASCRPGCGACRAGLGRVWWTPNATTAARLAAAATGAAETALTAITSAQALSRAEDADIEIGAPAGLSYRGYQKAGVKFALDAFARGQKGVLIGDEMGLGKTMQGIGTFVALGRPRTLVVAPASLLSNWAREIEKWAPGTAVQVIRGREAIDASADVVVMNYDKVAGPHGKKTAAALLAQSWGLAIFDEAQAVKNEKAQRTKVFFGDYGPRGDALKAEGVVHRSEHVLVLTGTPVPNRVRELVSTLRALDAFSGPNAVARGVGGFLFRYCDPQKVMAGRRIVTTFDGCTNAAELQDKLRAGWMVRRLKSAVAKELPPKIRQTIRIDCDEAVELEQSYDLSDFFANVDPDDYDDAMREARASVAFEDISRLRGELAGLKAPYVTQHVDDLLESVEKVIVFGHHKVLVQALAGHYGETAIVIDGTTDPEDRQTLVDRFQNDPSIRVAVLSTHAAGVGLTLTAASVVVFGEADWAPSWLVQAEDRAHRIGQTADVVHCQYLVFGGTLDARVMEVAIAKLATAAKVLDNERPAIEVQKSAPAPKAAALPPAKRVVFTARGECVEITEARKEAVHTALQVLASRCDGAREEDGAGFNRLDTGFGKQLAAQERLSDKQAAAAIAMVRKYRGQLPEELCDVLGLG